MSVEVELKSKIFKLLKEDEEFRYAVAGLIGLEEILRRLEKHDERFISIEEEIRKLREDMNKGFERYDEELARLREDMNRGFERYDRELAKLREDMNKGFERYSKELTKLREDMNRGFQLMDRRLRYLEAFTERVSLTLEEEAIEVVAGKLSEKGIRIKLDTLILPDIEVNIYGVGDDICVIGEVATRAGTRIIEEIDEKVKQLSIRYPEHMRKKIVKVLYTMWITREAVEEARNRKIWILKTTQELTPLELTA